MKTLIFLVILMLTFSFALYAGELKHQGGRMKVWLPDNWTIEKEDNDTFEANDPNEEVYLYFEMLEAEDLKATLDSLEKELEKEIDNLKVTSSEEVAINGLDGYNIDATGKYEGKAVELSVLLIKTKQKGKVLLLNGFIYKDKLQKHLPTLRKILKSVQSY